MALWEMMVGVGFLSEANGNVLWTRGSYFGKWVEAGEDCEEELVRRWWFRSWVEKQKDFLRDGKAGKG